MQAWLIYGFYVGPNIPEFAVLYLTVLVKYHMKKFLILALILSTSLAHAEPRRLNKPVVCESTEKVFRTMVEEFGETPQWRGSTSEQGTSTVLTVNLKTGAWTLIEYTSVMACVIGVGENSSSAWGVPV
jgi:hypothetical protein